MDADAHRRCRELLGPYVLGHLGPAEVAEVERHCLRCEVCAADLAEIAPLATALPPRGSEPRRGPSLQDLEDQVVRAARRRRRLPYQLAAAASAVLVVALSVGVTQQLGVPDQGLGIREDVAALEVAAGPVAVSEASVMPHTWGTEVFFTVEGLEDGATYEVVLLGRDGEEASAGTLLGDSTLPVVCVLNGAKLRQDVVAFEVREADTATVVWSSQLQPYTPGEV